MTEPSIQRRTIATFIVAGVLASSGAAHVLSTSGKLSLPLGIAALVLALALLCWPRQVRWLVVAHAAAGPLVVFFVALWYFLTLPLYPFLLWGGLVFLGYVLLLFGEPTRRRTVAGVVLLGLAVVLFPFANPQLHPAYSPEACEARVAELATRARAYSEPGPPVQTHRAELPSASWGPQLVDYFPVLVIARDAAWFAGTEMPEDEPTRVQTISRWFEEHGAGLKPEPSLYLAADRRLRAEDLAPLLGKLPRVRVLLVATTEPLGEPPPGARSLAEQLARLGDSGGGAALFANQLSRRAGSCPPFAKRLVTVSDVPPPDRAEVIVKSLETGLPQCGCGWVDLDALRYVVLRGFGADQPLYLAFALKRNAAGQLELPARPELTVERWVSQLASARANH